MRITPVNDSNGEIASYIAIKPDVTARRAAEETQVFLAAIVASSDDAIIAFAPTGILLTWNRGAEVASGYSAGRNRQDGGTIGVDSREGRGSTFWFTVAPALEPLGQSDASSEGQKAPEAAPGAALEGLRL